MIIEYADPSDAGAILGILTRTFPAEILTRTPLGCAGARQYVADTIGARHRGSDVVWIVARDPEVVGFAELRLGPDELFLNHLHVSPTRQSQGNGRSLLRTSIELARPPRARRIGLGVFRDRERPIGWYSRLSFVEVQTTRWLTLSPDRQPAREWYCLGELLQADCTQLRYGFSQLSLRTVSGTYRIGRLGSRFFRTPDASILRDSAALAALGEIGPDQPLVVTVPGDGGGTLDGFRTTHRMTALQMSAEIDTVLARLRG